MKSKNICIIPIRSKSKGIINKNIKKINGIPLICFTLNACLESKIFDKIIIVSDSKKYLSFIKKLLKKNDNVKFYLRSKKSATDKSPSEYVLGEVIANKNLKNNSCFFIQATSPLLNKNDIIYSYKKYKNDKLDSLFTSYLTKKFVWKKFNDTLVSLNYDYKKRKMRQDQKFSYVENGALYIFNAKNLVITKNRLHKKIGTYVMPKNRSIEIDEPEDIKVLKIILDKKPSYKKNILKNFKII
jgi:N-acylneuraminate cytidylyltransferase